MQSPFVKGSGAFYAAEPLPARKNAAGGRILYGMNYILFTGGGSAGHVVPNLALMKALDPFFRIGYLGTGGMEEALVRAEGYDFYRVDCPKLVRKLTAKNLTLPFRIPAAVKKAERFLRADPPDLVFSKGGYASFPAAAAAFRLHVPVVTHESDLSPGLCTRLLAGKCRFVLTAFPETAQKFARGRCLGAPLRGELFTGGRRKARRKYGLPEEGRTLLVLGGGSGSAALNRFVREHLPSLLDRYSVLHLCGKGNAVPFPCRRYVQCEYEPEMQDAYAAADAVLARAGSNTVFEVLALKKPAALVPLEKASRGDQLQNARYFAEKGLCAVLRERELSASPKACLLRIRALADDRALRAALDACTLANGTPQIAALLSELAASPAHAAGTRSYPPPKSSLSK